MSVENNNDKKVRAHPILYQLSGLCMLLGGLLIIARIIVYLLVNKFGVTVPGNEVLHGGWATFIPLGMTVLGGISESVFKEWYVGD